MKEAKEIVGLVKEWKRIIQSLYAHENIDFLGCSSPYVLEKIDALIYELQQFRKHIRAVDKRQEQ